MGEELSVDGFRDQEELAAGECPVLLRRHIGWIGMDRARAGYKVVRHSPASPIVIVLVSGQMEFLVDGEWHHAERGHSYIAPVGHSHGLRLVEGQTAEFAWVAYAFGETHTANPGGNLVRPQLSRCEPSRFQSIVEGVLAEARTDRDPSALLHWVELLHLEAVRISGISQIDERLERLWSRVETDIDQAWTAESLAKSASLSVAQFARLTKQTYGHAPMQHLAWLRMRHAAHLLVTGQETVDSAARKAGYKSVPAFSVAFKRVMRVSPSEYRSFHSVAKLQL